MTASSQLDLTKPFRADDKRALKAWYRDAKHPRDSTVRYQFEHVYGLYANRSHFYWAHTELGAGYVAPGEVGEFSDDVELTQHESLALQLCAYCNPVEPPKEPPLARPRCACCHPVPDASWFKKREDESLQVADAEEMIDDLRRQIDTLQAHLFDLTSAMWHLCDEGPNRDIVALEQPPKLKYEGWSK